MSDFTAPVKKNCKGYKRKRSSTDLRYCPDVSLEALGKTTKTSSQDSLCHGWYSNLAPRILTWAVFMFKKINFNFGGLFKIYKK
jgi:hypothetical protein